MSDMDDFLGKTVRDSLEDAANFSRQMDGIKLLGQRQINIAQQEQISADRAHIRQLEQQITELRRELHKERKANESSASGPTNGWAQVRTMDNKHYRTQSPDGYQKEVRRLQQNIIEMVQQSLFRKINVLQSNEHSALLAQALQVPTSVVVSTRRMAVIQYIATDNNKEHLATLRKGEGAHAQWFLNKRTEHFDLIDFHTHYQRFELRWLAKVYMQEEHLVLEHLRAHPEHTTAVQKLLASTLSYGINFENPFVPSLQEMQCLLVLDTKVHATRSALCRYQGYLNLSDAQIEALVSRAKEDILDNQLTARETEVYDLALPQAVCSALLLEKGIPLYDLQRLPKEDFSPEDLKKIHHNIHWLHLQYAALKKVLVQLALQEAQIHPTPEPTHWDAKYEDLDPARKALEQLYDLREQLQQRYEAGSLHYPFVRWPNILFLCAQDDFLQALQQGVQKRENEKEQRMQEERQREYDEGLALLKCYLEHKEDVLALLKNPQFANGTLVIPAALQEPLTYMMQSKASIPTLDNDFAHGVVESQDPAHRLTYTQAQSTVEFFLKALRSLASYHLTLVASKPVNIGNLFSKKMVQDVYIRAVFPMQDEHFRSANLIGRHKQDIKPAFKLADSPISIAIAHQEGYSSMPNVIYIKLGQFSPEEHIQSVPLIITQTPGGLIGKNNLYETKPFNECIHFSALVRTLPLAPDHAAICAAKVLKRSTHPDLKTQPKESFTFSAQELNVFSEGLRYEVPQNKS